MRLALMLGAAAAILVCLAVVVTWEDQFPVSMISALRAKGEAKQLDKLSNGKLVLDINRPISNIMLHATCVMIVPRTFLPCCNFSAV